MAYAKDVNEFIPGNIRDNKIKRKGYSGPIENSCSKILSRILRSRGFPNLSIINNWDKIVGNKMSEFSCPIKIEYSGDEGILFIEVNSGAASVDITHSANNIIDKIITYCGYKIVSKIRVVRKIR